MFLNIRNTAFAPVEPTKYEPGGCEIKSPDEFKEEEDIEQDINHTRSWTAYERVKVTNNKRIHFILDEKDSSHSIFDFTNKNQVNASWATDKQHCKFNHNHSDFQL